ncbi:MAG: hypothetical protein AABY91_06795 [Gemmatimonadota bacterium]
MELLILADQPEAHHRLCGVSMVERILRIAERLGFRQALVLDAGGDPEATRKLTALAPARPSLAVRLAPMTEQPLSEAALRRELAGTPPDTLVLVVPGDGLYDSRLLAELARRQAPAALVDSRPPLSPLGLLDRAARTSRGALVGPAVLQAGLPGFPAGAYRESLATAVDRGLLPVIDVAGLDPYLDTMRRELRLLWLPAPSDLTRAAAETALMDSAQKGTLDLPALVHAPIENRLIRLLCRTAITPNQLTLLTNLFAWGATALFASGRLGAGILLALGVGVMDGLDGKQARVKVETTEAGRWEHHADWLYETSWWAALAWHFVRTGTLTTAAGWVALLVGSDLADRLIRRMVKQRLGRDLDTLAPMDRAIRLVGGRRNVYIWLFGLGWLVRQPAAALVLFCLWGTATTAAHGVRAWHHLRGPGRITPA